MFQINIGILNYFGNLLIPSICYTYSSVLYIRFDVFQKLSEWTNKSKYTGFRDVSVNVLNVYIWINLTFIFKKPWKSPEYSGKRLVNRLLEVYNNRHSQETKYLIRVHIYMMLYFWWWYKRCNFLIYFSSLYLEFSFLALGYYEIRNFLSWRFAFAYAIRSLFFYMQRFITKPEKFHLVSF